MKIKQLMKRKKSAHKGQAGHVLFIGGSRDYVGALILAGVAALRSGCDLVTIAAPEKVAWAVNCYSADLMTKKLKGSYVAPRHLKVLSPLIKKCDVIAFGNGMGLHRKSKKFCKKLVKITKSKFKVIDADAIKHLSLQEMNKAIITPHARELGILLDNSKLYQLNKINDEGKKLKMLQKYLKNNVLVIKGPADYIISKNKIKKVTGGNAGLAKGGTGDVLAGLCAGFLAQTGDLYKSAVAATTINKKIGDLLLKKGGYSFIASDMILEIKRLKNK